MEGKKAALESWGSSIKAKFSEMFHKMNISQESAASMALYGGLGVLSGFICKKSSSYVLAGLIVILAVALLHQYDVIHITVNWDEMSRILGIQPAEMTSDNLFAMAWEAIKANAAISLSYALGFFLGFKIG